MWWVSVTRSNPEAARRLGINVTGVTLTAYAFTALFATVSGMLLVRG